MAKRLQIWSAWVAVMCFVAPLSAQEAKPEGESKATATDEKKSDQPSLDELLGLPDANKADAPSKPSTPEKIDLDKAEIHDNFEKAVMEMRQSADRLAINHDASIETQRIQQRVIDRLEQLVREAEQRQQRKQQQKQQKSSKQAQKQDTGQQKNAQAQQKGDQNQQNQNQNQQSTTAAKDMGRRGIVRNGETADAPLVEKLAEWGNLPPRLRNELLQGREDRFSNLYKQLTELFYTRLAEEAK